MPYGEEGLFRLKILEVSIHPAGERVVKQNSIEQGSWSRKRAHTASGSFLWSSQETSMLAWCTFLI